MTRECLESGLHISKNEYWYSIKILATAPVALGGLIGAGYLALAVILVGILVYLIYKDADIKNLLSRFRWAVCFPIVVFMISGLMVYFSSIYLYVTLLVAMFTFFMTASSCAKEIEFEENEQE